MFFVTQVIQGASESGEERQFIICEKSEIRRRQDVEVISVGFKTAASAKAFAKKLIGKLHPEGGLFLDSWEEDVVKTLWNWKDERTGGASQVFKSEKGAFGAWRRNRLVFTKLLD